MNAKYMDASVFATREIQAFDKNGYVVVCVYILNAISN